MLAARHCRVNHHASTATTRDAGKHGRVFEQYGLAEVSTNRIAAELGISPGNLYYHFKTKREIVERLFRRLENEAEPILAGPSAPRPAVDDLWLFLHLVFEKMFEYRFAYRDMEHLATAFAASGARMRGLTARGIQTAERLCGGLVATGAMRASRDEVATLAFQMVFTVSCWMGFARMLPAGTDAGPGRAAYQVLTLVAPFLTDEARRYVEYLRYKYVG